MKNSSCPKGKKCKMEKNWLEFLWILHYMSCVLRKKSKRHDSQVKLQGQTMLVMIIYTIMKHFCDAHYS